MRNSYHQPLLAFELLWARHTGGEPGELKSSCHPLLQKRFIPWKMQAITAVIHLLMVFRSAEAVVRETKASACCAEAILPPAPSDARETCRQVTYLRIPFIQALLSPECHQAEKALIPSIKGRFTKWAKSQGKCRHSSLEADGCPKC